MKKLNLISNIHIGILLIVIFNFAIYNVHKYSFIFDVKVFLYIILLTSSVYLLILLKKNSILKLYLIFYPLSFLYFSFNLFLFKNYKLFPIISNNVVLYKKYNFYKLECCYYSVSKRQMILFEKHIGYAYIPIHNINTEDKLFFKDENIALETHTEYYNETKNLFESKKTLQLFELKK